LHPPSQISGYATVERETEGRSGDGITNQLLIQLQSTSGIFILAATNKPKNLKEKGSTGDY